MKALYYLLTLCICIASFTYIYVDVAQEYRGQIIPLGEYQQIAQYSSDTAILSYQYQDKFYGLPISYHPLSPLLQFDYYFVAVISIIILLSCMFYLISHHTKLKTYHYYTIFLFFLLGGVQTLALFYLPMLILLALTSVLAVLSHTKLKWLLFISLPVLSYYEPIFGLFLLVYVLFSDIFTRKWDRTLVVFYAIAYLIHFLVTSAGLNSIPRLQYMAPYFFELGLPSGVSLILLLLGGIVSVITYSSKLRTWYRLLIILVFMSFFHPVFMLGTSFFVSYSLVHFFMHSQKQFTFPMTKHILVVGILCCLFLSLFMQLEGIKDETPTVEQAELLNIISKDSTLLASPQFSNMAHSVGIRGAYPSFNGSNSDYFTAIDAPTYYSTLVAEGIDYVIYDAYADGFKNQTHVGVLPLLNQETYFELITENEDAALYRVLID